MDPEDIPSLIIKLGKKYGATDVAANTIVSCIYMIRFSNNEITVAKTFRNIITNVFVMIKERRAGSTIEELSTKSIEKNIKKIIYIAKTSPPGEIYAPLPKGPFKYNKKLLNIGKIKFDYEKLTDYVDEAINSALNSGAKRVAGSLIGKKIITYLKTSNGASGKFISNTLELSIRAFSSDIATGQFCTFSTDEKSFNPSEIGRIAGEIAKKAIDPKPGEPGKYDAIIGPMTFANLIQHLALHSSAFNVEAGLSFLVDKINQKIASEKLTLIDDATIENSYGSRPFDDEGYPTRRNIIVEKGILKTYLHNSITAKKFNTETTGNAGIIEPTPWNIFVEPGNKTFDELLSEIDNGIYVTNDWYLRYQNYRTGDFSTICRDGLFRIKNGEIIEPIRELRISDNMLRIFNNIIDLSKEIWPIKWWEVEIPTYAPFALIKEVNFTKSKM